MDDTKTQPTLSPEELKRAKINMWADKLKSLQAQFDDVRIRRGEAAREGDLRENAAYIDLTEQAEVLSARINDIQKMIAQLEEAGDKKDADK